MIKVRKPFSTSADSKITSLNMKVKAQKLQQPSIKAGTKNIPNNYRSNFNLLRQHNVFIQLTCSNSVSA